MLFATSALARHRFTTGVVRGSGRRSRERFRVNFFPPPPSRTQWAAKTSKAKRDVPDDMRTYVARGEETIL